MQVDTLGNYNQNEARKDYLDWCLKNLLASKDKEELHDFITIILGSHVPRLSVCPEHDAPFDFLADLFFEDVLNALVLANRNGGKTWNFAIKNALDAVFKGVEIANIGAIQAQAEKCFKYTQDHFKEGTLLNPFAIELLMKRSKIRTYDGFISELQILPGTMAGTNSPHPEKANLDEIDLMDWKILQEAMSMPKSTKRARASLCLTSTRKSGSGPMQKLLDEAKTRDLKVYSWCIWEVIENCSSKRSGIIPVEYEYLPYGEKDKYKRKTLWVYTHNRSLKNRYVTKEFLEEKSDPSKYSGCLACPLIEVCQTKAKRSDGYYLIDDTISKFRNLDRETWDAQWECKKPGRDGLVYKEFDDIHIIDRFDRSLYLPVDAGQDFGYTNPAHTVFMQKTNRDQIIIFDEIVRTQTTLNLLISEWWKPAQEEYNTLDWICDPEDPNAIAQMRQANIPARAAVDREVDAGIRTLRGLIKPSLGEPRLYILAKCVETIRDFQSYPYRPGTDKPFKDKFDHGCDAARYCIHTKWPSLSQPKKQFRATTA